MTCLDQASPSPAMDAAEPHPLPLPVDAALAAAAAEAHRLANLALQMAELIRTAPLAVGSFNALHGAALDSWSMIDERFRAAHEISLCKGIA